MKLRKTQAILEYGVLVATIIAAIMIMQVFMKRGISGRLKGASDQLGGGQSFSSSGTTTMSESNMTLRQVVHSEVATSGDDEDATRLLAIEELGIRGTMGIAAGDHYGVLDEGAGAYSATVRSGGDTISTVKSRTDSAAQEGFTVAEHADADVQRFDTSYQSWEMPQTEYELDREDISDVERWAHDTLGLPLW